MTLNLMLTSPDAVYLSGDFRLVSVEDQAPLRDSYHTQKLIPVIRHEWTALIAYMGIQSAPPLIHDMGQWILERIDAIPPAGDFSQLSIALLELNRWLPRMCGDRRDFGLQFFANRVVYHRSACETNRQRRCKFTFTNGTIHRLKRNLEFGFG